MVIYPLNKNLNANRKIDVCILTFISRIKKIITLLPDQEMFIMMKIVFCEQIDTSYFYENLWMKLGMDIIRTYIRKTCPCKVYPLEPHFYIAKRGYAGVYLFFLFLLQNIDCGYSLEPPRRGGSNVYPQSMF